MALVYSLSYGSVREGTNKNAGEDAGGPRKSL